MPSQPHGTDGAVYFNCTMCGDCCSSWNISIEAEKAVTLLEKEWVTSRLQQVNRSISKLSNEVYRIPLTAENVCIFLNPNKTCMIQEKEGLLLKPSECQRFPFASVVLPTGQLQHDTSAACKKIAEELLLTFQSILPNSDKTENMAHATIQQHKPTKETDYLLREDAEAFTGEFFLSLFQRLSLRHYQQFQEILQEALNQSRLSPLITLQTIAHQARQFTNKAISLTESRTTPVTQNNNQHSPIISSWKTRLLLLMVLRKPYRTMSWIQLIFQQPYTDSRIFGFSIPMKEHNQVKWHAEGNLLANAFLFQLLGRKRMLARGTSLFTLLVMGACALALVEWYAKALAWANQRSATNLQDVSDAIRLTERYYTGHHPGFLKRFNNRWMGTALFWLLS